MKHAQIAAAVNEGNKGRGGDAVVMEDLLTDMHTTVAPLAPNRAAPATGPGACAATTATPRATAQDDRNVRHRAHAVEHRYTFGIVMAARTNKKQNLSDTDFLVSLYETMPSPSCLVCAVCTDRTAADAVASYIKGSNEQQRLALAACMTTPNAERPDEAKYIKCISTPLTRSMFTHSSTEWALALAIAPTRGGRQQATVADAVAGSTATARLVALSITGSWR